MRFQGYSWLLQFQCLTHQLCQKALYISKPHQTQKWTLNGSYSIDPKSKFESFTTFFWSLGIFSWSIWKCAYLMLFKFVLFDLPFHLLDISTRKRKGVITWYKKDHAITFMKNHMTFKNVNAWARWMEVDLNVVAKERALKNVQA